MNNEHTLRVVDTHCHPQMRQFDADRDEVIRRALDAGIAMICVGVDLKTSRQAIELARTYEGLYASVGLHPNDNLEEAYDPTSYELLAADPKVVAIGEIGLDYYRTTEPEKQVFQRERFLRQLDLARETGKPVVIHCRNAHTDMLSILEDASYVLPLGRRGVIHSFTGTVAEALHYIELGFHIGFNGIVTFARQYDEAVRAIPGERILLETDAPYLAPEPYRGKRNDPVHILETARTIAGLRGETMEDFIAQTTENASTLFSLR